MMGSMSGILQRPIMAAAALAVASVSTDLPSKLQHSDPSSKLEAPHHHHDSVEQPEDSSWVSRISMSKLANLSFVSRISVPVPQIKPFPTPNSTCGFNQNALYSPVAYFPALINLYQSADLAKSAKPMSYPQPISTPPPEDLYRWHLPAANAIDITGSSDYSSVKSNTVVVLLGWLGAKQKHLNRYAEYYTSRGFHAITFTFPMSEIFSSYKVGGKAEHDVELLVDHLADWLEEEGKNVVFHTFSNTGWLTYGVVLEKFHKLDNFLLGRIRGCIVDSAPVATPDPQVFASGFSAAFLKKSSVATKGSGLSQESAINLSNCAQMGWEQKPALTEAALLVLLEKMFGVVLNLPSVNRRLNDVLGLLSSRQPNCPQLYIYSSADRVIPAESVESFIEEQRRSGHEVRSCNFKSTPHVDHFRNDPQLYTSQLTRFFEDCVLTSRKS